VTSARALDQRILRLSFSPFRRAITTVTRKSCAFYIGLPEEHKVNTVKAKVAPKLPWFRGPSRCAVLMVI
jgi:hypothetical protein